MSTFERFQADCADWPAPDPEHVAAPPAPRGDDRLHLVLNEIEELEQGERPHGLTEQRWYELLKDLRTFSEQWLDLALGCGWSLRDVYGSPHELHHRRLDLTGVVLLLRGRQILSIDADRIVISNGERERANVLYRQGPGVSVPSDRSRASLVWDVLRRNRGRRVRW